MLRNWQLKRQKVREYEELARNIPRILARYGDLIEKYPTSYVDETALPLDKSGMKTVLRIALDAEVDHNRIAWLRTAWVLLSRFQPDIGPIPLSLEILERPTDADLANMDRYFAVAKKSAAEAEDDLRELRAANW
jgi:hypothetical protein